MKIAFIGQKGMPATVGGVEVHVQKLAVGLAKKGHQVFVYTRPWYVKRQQKTCQGVNIIIKKSWRTKNFDTITHVFLATIDVLKKDYDIVHYHGVGPALMSWLPKIFKSKTKVITTFHSIDRQHMKWGIIARFFLRLGEWFAVKFADETITVSRTLQKYCKQKYNADTIYIPNGIDFSKRQPANIITKKYGLKPNKYIYFLSRLIKHKGAHYLIDAYNKLDTDMKLVIAGAGSFTDRYVKSLHEKAKDNENIIFISKVESQTSLWRELYSNAYLFVLPSESEGLPIVILEAMSFGRCVLASSIPQNVEAIDGGFGFIFKNKNQNDLYKKLNYLLKNPKQVNRVGFAARDYVLQNYNWRDIIIAVESVYLCVVKLSGKQKIKQCMRRSRHSISKIL